MRFRITLSFLFLVLLERNKQGLREDNKVLVLKHGFLSNNYKTQYTKASHFTIKLLVAQFKQRDSIKESNLTQHIDFKVSHPFLSLIFSQPSTTRQRVNKRNPIRKNIFQFSTQFRKHLKSPLQQTLFLQESYTKTN